MSELGKAGVTARTCRGVISGRRAGYRSGYLLDAACGRPDISMGIVSFGGWVAFERSG